MKCMYCMCAECAAFALVVINNMYSMYACLPGFMLVNIVDSIGLQ